MTIFLVASYLLLAVSASLADKFHFMQKSVPRKSFVKHAASPSHEVHELVFAIKQRNLKEMDLLLTERGTPGNPLYQQWLTYEQVGEMTSNIVGAEAVKEWLAQNNIEVTWESTHSDYLKATAEISQWEQMLNTKFFQFEDHSRKSMRVEDRIMHRAEQYFLPVHMKEHLHAVFNTVQVPPVFKPHYAKALPGQQPRFKTEVTVKPASQKEKKLSYELDGYVTVGFLNDFYEISTNAGDATMSQSVFETAEESYSPTDLTLFQTTYDLPVQPALHPFGFNTSHCNAGDDTSGFDCLEGNLDVQYIMGVAQQTATIYWYVTDNSTTDPFVAWIVDIANCTNPPLVNSMSWGSIEQANDKDVMDAFNTEAMKLSAMGVTITVSSGDDGVASEAVLCNEGSGSDDYGFWTGTPWTGKGYFPSFPATSPYVTAVGATMGPESGDPEIACQSQLGGVITTGGGFSTYYPTPSWQVDTVSAYFSGLTTGTTPTSGYNPNGRGYPDVSMIGVWYQIFNQGNITSLFGTSASSPVFAALLTLTNTARAKLGKGPVGFINPTLYAKGSASGLFNDITSGENNCIAFGDIEHASHAPCCQSGFHATAGWDPTTGFGSMNYPNVLSMFDALYGDPSAEPTAQPTASPSAASSPSPTLIPTAVPSVAPSAQPSMAQSAAPNPDLTVTPTVSPSVTPSLSPSARPTVVPSAAGTVRPSAQPSAPPSPIVTFSSNITLAGLTAPELDGPSRNAVIQTTAQEMNVDALSVTYVGTIVLSTSPRLAPVASNLRQSTHILTNAAPLATTYSVIAITRTQVALSATQYSSTDALYSGLTSLLATSVSSGAYTTALDQNAQTLGATTLATASATSATSSAPTVVSAAASDDDDNSALDGGAIAGIVLGSIGFVLILGFFYYHMQQHKRRQAQEDIRASTLEFSNNNPIQSGKESL